MTGIITDITKFPSKHGGEFWRILIRCGDTTYHTYIDSRNRNYRYWSKVIKKYFINTALNRDTIIENLKIKSKTLIDGDSPVKIKEEICVAK